VSELQSLGETLSEMRMQDILAAMPVVEDDLPAAPPVCQRCQGAGYLRRDLAVGHPEFGVPVLCHCRAEQIAAARRERIWSQSGIPERYRPLTLSSWVTACDRLDPAYPSLVVIEQLAAWLASDRWLFLEGPFGRGKTALAIACLATLAERGESVLFTVVPDLLDQFRATFNRSRRDGDGDPSDQDIVAALLEVDVLCLDDLGKEVPSAWARERLYRLVNRRYLDNKRTLFTSNESLEVLGARLGEATTDRIYERARGGGLLVVDGPNLRMGA
jgi:DNA replication protein DnaC